MIPLQAVRKHYGHFARQDATLRVRFKRNEITLNVPVDGIVTSEGWRITPFSHPTVSKAWTNNVCRLNHNHIFLPQISRKDVDQFEPGQWIPECQLIVQWERENQKPVRLRQKVNLVGAKGPYDFIYLTLNPVMEQRKGSSHTKGLKEWGKRGSTEYRLGAKAAVWGECDKVFPNSCGSLFPGGSACITWASEPVKLNDCCAAW